jgi:hypothetical protein
VGLVPILLTEHRVQYRVGAQEPPVEVRRQQGPLVAIGVILPPAVERKALLNEAVQSRTRLALTSRDTRARLDPPIDFKVVDGCGIPEQGIALRKIP